MQYDYISKLETMDDDIKQILPKMNAKYLIGNFPQMNVGILEQNRYKNMYNNISKSLMEVVKEKYRTDAELFGYSMDGYGPS